IRLWFSEPVELAVTTAKLATASGTPVALGAVTRDTAKNAPVVAAVTKPLAAGSYVVTWSTAADDGQPAKGTIGLAVEGARRRRAAAGRRTAPRDTRSYARRDRALGRHGHLSPLSPRSLACCRPRAGTVDAPGRDNRNRCRRCDRARRADPPLLPGARPRRGA